MTSAPTNGFAIIYSMLELRPMAVVMSALRIARRVAALLGMNRRTLWADGKGPYGQMGRALHFASIDAIVGSERCLILSRINGLAEMEIRQSAAFIPASIFLPKISCPKVRCRLSCWS